METPQPPEDDFELTTCNADGAFLKVTLSGVTEGRVGATDPVSCGSIGGGGDSRGVILTRTFDDGLEWSFQITGDFELGVAATDVAAEVFFFAGNEAANDSWFGDCRLDIATFDELPARGDWRDYLLGGTVRCAEPLEPFIGADGALTLSDFEFTGIHIDS